LLLSLSKIKKTCLWRRHWLVDSQGSEFEQVLLVLSGRDIPIITRELIYTGITRARQDVDIWASKDLLKRAILRRISRQSGLADALQNSHKETLSNSKPIQ
jgi:ATP-dependent exoDNAse (exonuclease V) alpha subunit